MNQYPYAGDYQAALQSPAAVFTDDRLKKAQFAVDGWGLPDAISGTSATVFHATIGGEGYALRCFTRSDASSRERYAAFDDYVSDHGLSQHIGYVTWHDDAVRVKSGTWPVLQMEWIEGRRLNDYVGYLVDDGNTGALATLASRWLDLVGALQQARFAHGDLQHGNVIIDRKGKLRLVDFDGVWIPPLQSHEPPTETGHENYQPQGRSARVRWGPWMDTFSALVIHLALTALALDPGLWLPLNNGDNLLFERKDFVEPFETEVWKHLARVPSDEVTQLADKLRTFCAPGWEATQSLSDALRLNWWEQKGTSPVPRATTGPAPTGTRIATGPPTGSPASTTAPLPPPPAWTYQPKVAPAAPKPAASGTGAQSWVAATSSRPQAAMPTSKTGIPTWWQPQAPAPPPPPPAPPATRSSARQVAGILSIIVGLVLFAGLQAAHDTVAAVFVGLAGVIAGISLLAGQTQKKPGP